MVRLLSRRRVKFDIDPDVDRYAKAILAKAQVGTRLPTPVDDVITCARLAIAQNVSLEAKHEGFFTKSLGVLQSALKKAKGLVDLRENTIYLDLSALPSKQAFVKLHECGHKVLPWQREALLYIDDDNTLSPEVNEQFEREANHFAAEVLFQGERFDGDLRELSLSMKSALALAKRYGASAHATIRRFVERHHRSCAVLVLEKVTPQEDGAWLRVNRVCQSERFTRKLGQPRWPNSIPPTELFVQQLARKRRYFESQMTVFDETGRAVECRVEVFDNSYNVFALVVPSSERRGGRTRVVLLGPDGRPI